MPRKNAPSAPDKAPRTAVAATPRRPGLLASLALCVVAGVGIFLSFPFSTTPDSNIWPLAWFAFVPFLWALRDASPKRAFWLGAVCGLVTNFGGFWWVSGVLGDFGHLSDPVAWSLTAVNAFYQGLCYAIFAWIYARVRPRRGPANIVAIAALFTVVEFLFPLIFPWYLGNGQYRFLPAIQIADITGVMGITFVIVLFNAALLRLLEARLLRLPLPRRQVLGAFAFTAAALVYGVIRIAQVDADITAADKLRLGMVEADIGIWEKQAKDMPRMEQVLTLHRNLLKHQEMSRDLAARGAELIVWPESSYFPLDDPFIKRSDRFAVGLSAGGALLAWRHLPEEGFGWVVAAGRVTDEGAGYLAVDAEREDAWATVGVGGKAAIGEGQGARPLATGTTADLFDVAVVTRPGSRARSDGAPIAIWAVGADGVIVTGDGDGLAPIESPTHADLRAIAMADGRNGVAVGDGGAAVQIANGRAKAIDLGTSYNLLGAWYARGSDDAVIVGAGGVAFSRVDGAPWVSERTGVSSVLRHVVRVDATREVLAAGDDGAVVRRLVRHAGERWAREAFPSDADVSALAVDARGVVLAATEDGSVFVRDAPDRWRRVPTEGLGAVVAMTGLPYVQTTPLPRDVRYLWQSTAPLPGLAAFMDEPSIEFDDVSAPDRTTVQRGFTTPILFGGITWEDPTPEQREDPASDRRTKYNTAIMLDDVGRVVGTYDKVYLLAFGEYMPFGDMFPGLYDAFPQSGRFTPGREVRAFQWGDRRIGVMICYEDILAKFTGKLAAKDPNIIINVTNDAWFGHTSEPYLHLALSVFRSVETRLVLARATNTGVSAIIDPVGRVVSQTRLTDAETTLEDVPLMRGATFYGRVGDLFTWALALGLIAWVVVTRRRERRAGDDDASDPSAERAPPAPKQSRGAKKR